MDESLPREQNSGDTGPDACLLDASNKPSEGDKNPPQSPSEAESLNSKSQPHLSKSKFQLKPNSAKSQQVPGLEKHSDSQLDTRRTSDMLREIAHMPHKGDVTIRDFVAMLGDRSFAVVILIFALPNSIPVPGIPGFSTITGLPIILIALQIALGRDVIWLPKKMADKRFSFSLLTKIINKSLPVMLWLEKLLHPRFVIFCEGFNERLIGLLIVALATILALPIPGGNFLPGVSILLLSMALLEKDGILALSGMIISVGSIIFMYKVIAFVISELASWIITLLGSGVLS